MQIVSPSILEFQRKGDGTLTVLEKTSWPFVVNRMFFIQNVKKLGYRGDHAHKSCQQFIFPITGAVDISYKNDKETAIRTLDSVQTYGLLVPPMNWIRLRMLRPKTIICVLCSQEFSEEDYIRDPKVFNDLLQQPQAST